MTKSYTPLIGDFPAIDFPLLELQTCILSQAPLLSANQKSYLHGLSDHQPISSKQFYLFMPQQTDHSHLHSHFSSCSTRAFISPPTFCFHLTFPGVTILRRRSLHRRLCFICFVSLHHIDVVFFYTYTILYIIPSKLLLINGFGDKCCWQQPFSPTLKRCLGCLSLGEKRWSQYFPSLSSPQELGIYRHTPPSLCAPRHPSHGLLCHSLTLAPSTGLDTWQAALGSRTTLIPTPFTHINSVFPIVHDIQ